MSDAPRARNCGMDPVRELHTGQRRVNGRINRPDTRKHLNLRALPSETLLHPEGRPHTDIGSDRPVDLSAPRSDTSWRIQCGHGLQQTRLLLDGIHRQFDNTPPIRNMNSYSDKMNK